MATLTLALPASVTKPPPKYRMYIRSVDNKYKFGALLAPTNVEYSNFGHAWSEIPRDGRSPYLVHSSDNLPKISFTMILAKEDPDWDATPGLKNLNWMASRSTPVTMTYGGYFDSRTWRITSLSFRSIMRHPSTSAITRAEIDLELTMASDVKLSTGPVSGGIKKKKNNKSKKPSSPKKPAPKTKYYTVKRGDTLSGIAIKLYRDASKWRKLADRNNIKNPKKLRVGQRLKY
jgi:hypothetical protein